MAIPGDLSQWLRDQEAAALQSGRRVAQSAIIRSALRDWKAAGHTWKDAEGA